MTLTSKKPINKVIAAMFAAGGAGAFVIILAWLVKALTGTPMPADVQAAFGVILSAAGAGLAGYYTPIAPEETVDVNVSAAVAEREGNEDA